MHPQKGRAWRTATAIAYDNKGVARSDPCAGTHKSTASGTPVTSLSPSAIHAEHWQYAAGRSVTAAAQSLGVFSWTNCFLCSDKKPRAGKV